MRTIYMKKREINEVIGERRKETFLQLTYISHMCICIYICRHVEAQSEIFRLLGYLVIIHDLDFV